MIVASCGAGAELCAAAAFAADCAAICGICGATAGGLRGGSAEPAADQGDYAAHAAADREPSSAGEGERAADSPAVEHGRPAPKPAGIVFFTLPRQSKSNQVDVRATWTCWHREFTSVEVCVEHVGRREVEVVAGWLAKDYHALLFAWRTRGRSCLRRSGRDDGRWMS